METMGKPTACEGCGVQFPSRSGVFKHLRETKGACLSKESYNDFVEYIEQTQREKVILLYGYYLMDTTAIDTTATTTTTTMDEAENSSSYNTSATVHARSGDDVVQILMEALLGSAPKSKDSKYTRSYSHLSRASDIVQQDDGTAGAVTELMTILLPPILTTTMEDWIQQMNTKLPANIRVFARRLAPSKKFNAETAVSHRRCEYMLPMECFHQQQGEEEVSLPAFLEQFSSFNDGEVNARPPTDTIMYLFRIKKIMQSLQTKVEVLDTTNKVHMMEKERYSRKRQRAAPKGNKDKKQQKNKKDDGDNNKKPSSSTKEKDESVTRLLQRRRFHNFTPKAMAHESLVYRRLDRCHHRATIRPTGSNRPFMVISLTADMFLTGQVQRVVGLVIALVRNIVDSDFVDLVFDENYPHLVPTPPAPPFAVLMSEAGYSMWEGKAKAVLMPRKCETYSEGFNDPGMLQQVEDWKLHVRTRICRQWEGPGEDNQGRLVSVQQWIDTVLEPWARKSRQQLDDYRTWKQGRTTNTTKLLPPKVSEESVPPRPSSPSLECIDKTIPPVYARVLHLLRKVDHNGRWPTTSTKRQLVMVSTTRNDKDQAVVPSDLSLNLASMEDGQRAAASSYSYEEGEGGASGSFTVGSFPNGQPKANEDFKDLIKAAFELEIALFPNREPSSTIAINRNAQFRPHVDSGAGSGQSTSLIVGLGDYSGGDLVVEGEQKDIRYKAIEFNGWKQRHWTMPFQGERYSLVWFTPKGCEGMRGIDL